MNRLIPALGAGVSVAMMGLRHSQELHRQCIRLARWASLTRHLALLLQEEAGSLPDVLRMAAQEEGEPDRILQAVAQRMRLQPLFSTVDMPEILRLSSGEQALLLRLFARLTQGSRDSRVQAAQECSVQFAQLSEAASMKHEADAKMWRQLGFLGGACLTLWLM